MNTDKNKTVAIIILNISEPCALKETRLSSLR